MQKKPLKRRRVAPKATSEKLQNSTTSGNASVAEPVSAAGNNPSSLNNLKTNLTGKRKAIFQILDDVKKVKPEDWKDPNQVENLAKNFASKLGLPVPEQRIKQFVNAYKDATKNGPNASMDDLVKKYGKNVDEKTIKEMKKFIPKSK